MTLPGLSAQRRSATQLPTSTKTTRSYYFSSKQFSHHFFIETILQNDSNQKLWLTELLSFGLYRTRTAVSEPGDCSHPHRRFVADAAEGSQVGQRLPGA